MIQILLKILIILGFIDVVVGLVYIINYLTFKIQMTNKLRTNLRVEQLLNHEKRISDIEMRQKNEMEQINS
ncbi:hypothetical protein GUI37_06050 [Helcococcus kunzii]|uniref:hypothetical protein n=1 Tax=Helcococcus kunzii TaxID=40091 RepID=UPI001BB0C910|nr:hypothetical protein [Helcococcus kunzii]QUY65102.1 hypothetical protein GUI37_06050 [Helcococcus kunzii]